MLHERSLQNLRVMVPAGRSELLTTRFFRIGTRQFSANQFASKLQRD